MLEDVTAVGSWQAVDGSIAPLWPPHSPQPPAHTPLIPPSITASCSPAVQRAIGIHTQSFSLTPLVVPDGSADAEASTSPGLASPPQRKSSPDVSTRRDGQVKSLDISGGSAKAAVAFLSPQQQSRPPVRPRGVSLGQQTSEAQLLLTFADAIAKSPRNNSLQPKNSSSNPEHPSLPTILQSRQHVAGSLMSLGDPVGRFDSFESDSNRAIRFFKASVEKQKSGSFTSHCTGPGGPPAGTPRRKLGSSYQSEGMLCRELSLPTPLEKPPSDEAVGSPEGQRTNTRMSIRTPLARPMVLGALTRGSMHGGEDSKSKSNSNPPPIGTALPPNTESEGPSRPQAQADESRHSERPSPGRLSSVTAVGELAPPLTLTLDPRASPTSTTIITPTSSASESIIDGILNVLSIFTTSFKSLTVGAQSQVVHAKPTVLATTEPVVADPAARVPSLYARQHQAQLSVVPHADQPGAPPVSHPTHTVRWYEVTAALSAASNIGGRRDGRHTSRVLLLQHTDVTSKLAAERMLSMMLDREHRMLENLFPRHVLEHCFTGPTYDVLAGLEPPLISGSTRNTCTHLSASMATPNITGSMSANRHHSPARPTAAPAGRRLRRATQSSRDLSSRLSLELEHTSASFSVLKAESLLPAKSLRRSVPNHHLQQLLSSITSIGPVEPREGWPARHCATGQDLSERSTGLDMSWLAVKRGSGCVQLMPEGVVGQLATSHAHVTIMFADMVGFTPLCSALHPTAVMELLNRLFCAFDRMLLGHNVYKVETVGDCYIVAGGLMVRDADGLACVDPNADGPTSATNTVNFAKALLKEASRVMMPTTGDPVQMRVGIHSGPLVSGVVGTVMPRFSLFGDTINVAARMESTSRPGCIHISEDTHRLLEADPGWQPVGGIQVKGKGSMETYLWKTSAAPPRHDR
ncbi:MAG: hypothetical protein WDW38_010370 [Sanguina aurantia]